MTRLPVCLLIVALAAPAVLAEATLDIRPSVCPNLIATDVRGLVPVAVVGDTDFNASRIDPGTLLLVRADGVGGSVAPLTSARGHRGRVLDVAAPANGMCSTFGVDGIRDLVVLFGTQELASSLELGALPAGSDVELCLGGQLGDGSSFEACDVATTTELGAPLRLFGGLDTRPLR